MSQPQVMYPEKRGGDNRSFGKTKSAAAVAAAALLKSNLGFKIAKHPEAVSVRPASYIHIKPDTSLVHKPNLDNQKNEKKRKQNQETDSDSELNASSEEEYFSSNETKDDSEESESEDDEGERVQFEPESSEDEAAQQDDEEDDEKEQEGEIKYRVLDINERPDDKGSRPDSRIVKSWASDARNPRGLLNTGVTCYMNSAIQTMIHVPPFANFLNNVYNGKYAEVSNKSVTKELAQLHHKLLDLQVTRNIYPAAIIRRLDDINPLMSMWQQEDSHEYFMSLLSRVQEDTVPPGKKLRTSILHEIFGGTYEQKVTCQTCKSVSTTHQDFYDLPVSFSSKERKARSKFTLQASIKEFFSPAVIKPDKSNSGGYECEKCKKHTTAITVSKIEDPSEYLPINIKRFNFKEKSSRKIKDPISYPMELDLTEYSINPEVPLKYKLISVTMHEGRTTSSGHYVVFCNQPNNTWALYDDETVRRVTEKAVLRHQEDAYFLVYARLTPVQVQGKSSGPVSSTNADVKKPSENTSKKLKRSISMPDLTRELSSSSSSGAAAEEVTTPVATPIKKVKKSKPGLKASKSLSNLRSPSLANGTNGSVKSPHSVFARMSDKLKKRRQEKKRARLSEENIKHQRIQHNLHSNSKHGAEDQGVKKRKLDSEIDKIFGGQ